MTTVKVNRLSIEGVARGLPAVLAQGTWNTEYAMYGGDFLSKDGRTIFYQITETAMHLAIGSYTALYTYVSGGTLYAKSVKGTTLSAAKLIDTPVSTGTTGHQLLWSSSYNSGGTNYDVYYVFDINSTGYANTRVIVNATTGSITRDLGQDTTAGSAVVFYRPILIASGSGRCTAHRSDPWEEKYDLLSLSSAGAQISDAASTIAKVGDLWFMATGLWFQNNSDDHVKIQFTTDSGANYTEVSGGDGSTDYSLVAVDGTYLYATKAGSKVIWKGTLSNGNVDVDWTSFFDLGELTFNGMDANASGDIIIGVLDGVGGSWLILLDKTLDITMTSCRIKLAMNTIPSIATIVCPDSSMITQDMMEIKIYDNNDVKRFAGYPLPAEGDNRVICESVDRILKSPVNATYNNTLHEIADDVVVAGMITIGNNVLNDVTNHVQVWGASISREIALSSLAIIGACYWRPKVNSIDLYTRAAPNASGKTITFGTTTAILIGKRNSVIKPINKLVCYGAWAEDIDGLGTDGILQVTYKDDADIAVKGEVPLYIRRNDVNTYTLLDAFAAELWAHRSNVNALPKVFTIKLMGVTWLDAGDTITIAGGTAVDAEFIDGTYFMLSCDTDIVQNIKIIELSTSYTANVRDYNDVLPIASQVDVQTTNSTQGDAITPKSLPEVLGSSGGGGLANIVEDTTPQIGYGSVEGLADHDYLGQTITATAGENLAIGDFVYFKSDTKLWKAKADAIATAQCIGVCCVAANANAEATVLIYGFIRDDSFAAMTVGGTIYLSTGTAGQEQNTTVPSANTHCVVVLGVAMAAKILFVKPCPLIVEVIA